MGNVNKKHIDDENLHIKKCVQESIKLQESTRLFKILILGTGETGKSTIVKQMKIIHQNGYTSEERQNFRSIVFHNVIESMANILRGMHSLNISFSNANSKIEADHFIHFVNKNEAIDELNKDVCCTIKSLWEDPDVKRCLSRSSEYELGDSAK